MKTGQQHKVRKPVAKEGKVRLVIECSKEEHKRIKMLASYTGKSMRVYIMDCVKSSIAATPKKITQGNVPNEKTSKALKESERGEGLVSYESLDEMFKDLGI
jgi:hypothetical protein